MLNVVFCRVSFEVVDVKLECYELVILFVPEQIV